MVWELGLYMYNNMGMELYSRIGMGLCTTCMGMKQCNKIPSTIINVHTCTLYTIIIVALLLYIFAVFYPSLSPLYSPERSPRESLLDLDDTQAILGNRLPKAKDAMEAQLIGLLDEFSGENKQFSDSNVNFGRQQILDFVRDLLEKSQQNYLSKDVFIVFSENIRGAVTSVRSD